MVFYYLHQVNVVNIGTFVRSVYMMTDNSNEVITLTSLLCSEVALPFSSPFLVFKSLQLVDICTLMSAF